MGSLLLLGLFIGMRHALEADHVAAVAALVCGKQSLTQTIKMGSVWGLGHTITLFLFGSIVIYMDTVMSAYYVAVLETAVGIMLILLGADVLRRMRRNKIHFHSHQHSNGNYHFHAHSHANEPLQQHADSKHEHEHGAQFPLRALMVGMMHGMAGSAAVTLLALGSATSVLQGMLYILLFGIGSLLGMALLSVAISFPIHLSAKRFTSMHNSFQLAVGLFTIGLGAFVIYENSAILVMSGIVL